MNYSSQLCKRNKYDYVICLAFDTCTMIGVHGLFGKVPLVVMHHRNIDELNSKIKRLLFSSYKNSVFHVVFEPFFKERLVQGLAVKQNHVFVIPHPVQDKSSRQTSIMYDCVGLCNGNDEGFIREAIDRERDFSQHNLRVLLRSRKIEKKDGSVRVITGFMQKQAYDELLGSGRTVLVPLPTTYVYRLSGSIYDALSRKKYVYTTSKVYAQDLEVRYPGVCKYFGSINQLIESLQEDASDGTDGTDGSFGAFIADHSIETVSREIEHMVNTIR